MQSLSLSINSAINNSLLDMLDLTTTEQERIDITFKEFFLSCSLSFGYALLSVCPEDAATLLIVLRYAD